VISGARAGRGALLFTVCVAVAVGALACQPRPEMDVFGTTPTFELIDQTGAPFASRDLTGRVALVDFVYTHCTDACPLLSTTFQQAQGRLADEKLLGSKVLLVSLSVDPQHDTPSVLAEYGQRFNADPSAWKLLTGDWDAVYDAVTGFKVATRPPRPPADAPAPGGTELSHSTRIVLIDPQQQVRAYFEGQDATADDLVSAAKRLVK
jgi:protein SCO1/2